MPKEPMTNPQIMPPIIPSPIIGIHAFVIIASGKLRSSPNNNPLTHVGKGKLVAPITKPIPNLLTNAPVIAAFLSSNVRGIIVATEIAPKTMPQIIPRMILDMAYSFRVRDVTSDLPTYKKQIVFSNTKPEFAFLN